MGVLEGKVAFISGGARGQGRSHAIRLAQEGADIVTFDICQQFDTVAYTGATEDDLAETVEQVEALDRRIVAKKADVRDQEAVQAVFDEGIAELGRVDIVLANAGIMPIIGEPAKPVQAWHDCIDVMLTGVLYTIEAAVPTLIEQGQGGSIVITSSTAGLKAPVRTLGTKNNGLLGYIAAKHGVVGLMRAYANSLGPYSIRCNTIHPTGVNTPMIANQEFADFAELEPSLMDAMHNTLPIPMVEAVDISNAIVYLSSDAGRYVNGIQLPVDAGATAY
ncbi:MAG TPA: mycofactocin-coupled SDR family oxidoreductase [Pseudonocardia sp.]|jgi:SDR family mycofactocin-dependent oxidoreductase|nr:mycofactocin-coupled SDR family oxidoreductase [Pseudonocardia sp.]